MIQINLLPWREQERKKRQTRFAIIAGGFVGLGILMTLFIHTHYAALIHRQLQRNDFLQTTLNQQSDELMNLDKNKKELNDMDAELRYIFSLRLASYRAVRLLDMLAQTNPDSVTLYKVIRAGDTIRVFGKAKSNLQVTLYMESLEKLKMFSQPVLTEISGKEGDTGEERIFELKIEQQE